MSEPPDVPIRGMKPASALAGTPPAGPSLPPAGEANPPPAIPPPATYRRLRIAELHAEVEDFRNYLAAGVRGVLAHVLGHDGELSRLLAATKTGRLMVDLAAGSDHADSTWAADVLAELLAANDWLEAIDLKLLDLQAGIDFIETYTETTMNILTDSWDAGDHCLRVKVVP